MDHFNTALWLAYLAGFLATYPLPRLWQRVVSALLAVTLFVAAHSLEGRDELQHTLPTHVPKSGTNI